jgi:hypothetical protein
MSYLILKQKEAKVVTFTVTVGGVALDLTGCTFYFGVKRKSSDTTFSIDKDDADFVKTQAALGIVSVFLTATDLDLDPGTYIGELKTTFTDLGVDKSDDVSIVIKRAVTD